MDRGDRTTDGRTSADALRESVATNASARVGEILAEAEEHGRRADDDAERAAAAAERAARGRADAILAEAAAAARAAARGRANELLRLQASIAARGPALADGLEGGGLTRARLEALVDALGAVAERVIEAADAPLGEGLPPAPAASGSEPPSVPERQPVPERPPVPEPAASGTANGAPPTAGSDGAGSAPGTSPAVTEDPRSDAGDRPERYDGPLPEGAPMARKPRGRERDARFAAVLLAVQGRERGEVESHLRDEYGVGDCDPILDEVFGRADAPA
jgi:hypothetical protein